MVATAGRLWGSKSGSLLKAYFYLTFFFIISFTGMHWWLLQADFGARMRLLALLSCPHHDLLVATAGQLLARLRLQQGGYSRVGTGSEGGSSLYPRVDPAVIMLITSGSSISQPAAGQSSSSAVPPAGSGTIVNDDWCLLGRKAAWPAGRFSTLAGFLEVRGGCGL
eukprot:1149145-Pelagomonas_calceolata.AAC.4